jgi:hypothetical protein
LTASPFSLTFGDSVFVKVVAINSYGESIESNAANGAIILTVPSAPVGLTNVNVTNSSSAIRLSWMNGVSTGGTPIIDYRVTYD